MMKMVLVLFLFASALKSAVSLQPHALDSFDVGYIQMKGAQNCSYLVKITTSCSSPKFTKDDISIAFGDANGNQVYAAKLNDSLPKTFEQCTSDPFQINGPCTSSPICSLYLYRSGSSDNYGWKPESVKIYGYKLDPVTFIFNTTIPKDTWYGHNFCDTPDTPHPPPPDTPHTPPSPHTPPPPPPHTPHTPPSPDTPHTPPPPPHTPPSPDTPPSSSSIQLSVQKSVLFVMVLGSVFSTWM